MTRYRVHHDPSRPQRFRDSLAKVNTSVPFYMSVADAIDIGKLYTGEGDALSSAQAREVAAAALASMDPTDRRSLLSAYGPDTGELNVEGGTGGLVVNPTRDGQVVDQRGTNRGATLARATGNLVSGMNDANRKFWAEHQPHGGR